MDFINKLLNNPQASLDPLNFIGILATVIVSIYIFKNETHNSFAKERHDKLIFPLFNILEPVLYQKNYEEPLKKALDIIKQNKNLADGKLLEYSYNCTNNPSKENFIALCHYINKAYDRSCRRLGLKTRSISYRVNRRQYKNKNHLFLYATLYLSFRLAILSAIFFIFSICAFSLSSMINDSKQADTLAMTIILLFALIGLRHVDKIT